MNTHSSIRLEAIPAVLGWTIVARAHGETYMVECGLSSPDSRLAYWDRNLHVIEKAIDKARGKEATPTP